MDFHKLSKLFYKKRLIFATSARYFNNLNFVEKKDNLSFELISSNNFHKIASIYESSENDPKLKILKNRLNRPDIWKGVIANLDKKPVGCHWILLPSKEKILYDSFEISNKAALFCGVFVNPNYRGKRIYNSMQQFAYNMWITDFPDRNIITIVENENKSSLKSNFRIGLEVTGVNHLFKFFWKKIFFQSITHLIIKFRSGMYYLRKKW
ncbi:hypothetical protein [Methanosarcina horonobensis]|uniref:hypothetical protein n=1 Tax=Methanosarcina horonobensis TaxID=418008 RepID=UPI000AD3FE48|nr:hypothetical protein [Methanosarcina horonobensis]